jgi:hypothetical protein
MLECCNLFILLYRLMMVKEIISEIHYSDCELICKPDATRITTAVTTIFPLPVGNFLSVFLKLYQLYVAIMTLYIYCFQIPY